ncbi:biotin carboxyl carrier protein of acetyl-CoA carboxylase [Oxobacter pfennigii]|uniref:Biotin carboxyl carrier protein of acetyl-CoA carboxylase n=1 Tax=Oxobacter pfennigii TaxID=36849 RepID=A0A0P8W2C3_9CLOT|nr:acetyl-CoA carboxylase biotin carboxyl carrier protein [Oxobacter pfennigii]KPU42671.1 biotin carboxyl carrier protein of acetyl-CoA carboxylase [Oxobacter pfennigii]
MDFKEIKDIIELVGKMGFAGFELEKGDVKLKISCNNNVNTGVDINNLNNVYPTYADISQSQTENTMMEDIDVIKSPMLGTFYITPSPDSEPYVAPGMRVTIGDTICIIEAMKVMNEITSEYDGEIVEILVNNGELVEYGQPLMVIRK